MTLHEKLLINVRFTTAPLNLNLIKNVGKKPVFFSYSKVFIYVSFSIASYKQETYPT